MQRAVEQDPLTARNYGNLGLAFHSADRLDEAEAAMQKALELNPVRGITRSVLSLVFLAQGRAEEALATRCASRRRGSGSGHYR